MKRVLSLVLALVMVLGMIPTFAAEGTGGELLKEYGFITGGTNGDLMEAKDFTREELAAVMSQLYGLEEDAKVYKGEAEYSDVDMISDWALPYVAFNEVNGWMQGRTDGSFDPKGIVTGQELAALLLKVLGYEFTWANALEVAGDLDLVVADEALTRGAGFEAIWTAVSEVKLAGEDMTLGVKLEKLDPPAPVVTELAVDSVVATNLKEVVVTFNQAVDKDTVKAANFTLSPSAGTLAPALSEDGMTVTITTTTTLTNQGAYKLTVENVATAEEMKVAKTVKDFTAFDATLPTAEKIVVTGPKAFDVYFSEPINTGSGSVTVKSANTTLAVKSATPDKTNVVSVELYTELTDATVYDITVKDYVDFAGYKNVIKTFNMTYAKDANAPVVSLVSANQQYVVVEFDKPVTGIDRTYFYHTFSAWTPINIYKTKADMDAATNAITTATTNVKTVYVQFATTGASGQFPLQPGNVNVHVLGVVGTASVKDNWGNKLATTVLNANVVADLTAPEVTKVEATANNKIAVTFSKAVAPGTTANYEVLKSDGTAISGLTFTVAAASTTKVELTLSKSLLGETVVVNVKNIEDTTLNKNKLVGTATNTITFADKEFAGVSRVELDSTNKLLYVVYKEAMDNSAIDVSNYKLLDVNATVANTVRTLSGPATFFSGNSVVKIELSATEFGYIQTGTDKVLISNSVKDLAGNGPSAFQLSEDIIVLGSGSAKPAVKEVETVKQIIATDKNTVTVQFDQVLTSVKPEDFQLSIGNNTTYKTPTGQSLANNATGTLVTLTFADDIPAAVGATIYFKATFTANETVNVFGVTPTNIAEMNAVVDKIVPTINTNGVETLDADNDGIIDHIKVVFSEPLKQLYVTPDKFTVADHTVADAYLATVAPTSATDRTGATVVAFDSTGTTLYVRVTEKAALNTGLKPTLSIAAGLRDAVNNALAVVENKASVDKVKPQITEMVLHVDKAANTLTMDTDKLVITFSEAVHADTIAAITGVIAVTNTDETLVITGLGTFVGGYAVAVADTNLTSTVTWNDDKTIATFTFKTTSGATATFVDGAADMAVTNAGTPAKDLAGNVLYDTPDVANAKVTVVNAGN